jgi:hypothetical protein
MEMQALGLQAASTRTAALAETVLESHEIDAERVWSELQVSDEEREAGQIWRMPLGRSPHLEEVIIGALRAGRPATNLAARARDLYDWNRTAALFDAAIREAILGHADAGVHPVRGL